MLAQRSVYYSLVEKNFGSVGDALEGLERLVKLIIIVKVEGRDPGLNFLCAKGLASSFSPAKIKWGEPRVCESHPYLLERHSGRLFEGSGNGRRVESAVDRGSVLRRMSREKGAQRGGNRRLFFLVDTVGREGWRSTGLLLRGWIFARAGGVQAFCLGGRRTRAFLLQGGKAGGG